MGGKTLVALDGTEHFCSQKLACANCLTRKRSNGKTENYHCLLSATVVAPGHSKVVPLMPEFIATQDGAEKQDCELSVNLRFIARGALIGVTFLLGRREPPMRLSATASGQIARASSRSPVETALDHSAAPRPEEMRVPR